MKSKINQLLEWFPILVASQYIQFVYSVPEIFGMNSILWQCSKVGQLDMPMIHGNWFGQAFQSISPTDLWKFRNPDILQGTHVGWIAALTKQEACEYLA